MYCSSAGMRFGCPSDWEHFSLLLTKEPAMASICHRPLWLLPSWMLPSCTSRRTTTLFHRCPTGLISIRHPVSACPFGSLHEAKPSESYLLGPTEPPLLEHTLAFHWTQHILPNYHDRPALVARTEPPSSLHQPGRNGCLRLTYSQLDQSINSLALGLYQLGIRCVV